MGNRGEIRAYKSRPLRSYQFSPQQRLSLHRSTCPPYTVATYRLISGTGFEMVRGHRAGGEEGKGLVGKGFSTSKLKCTEKRAFYVIPEARASDAQTNDDPPTPLTSASVTQQPLRPPFLLSRYNFDLSTLPSISYLPPFNSMLCRDGQGGGRVFQHLFFHF